MTTHQNDNDELNVKAEPSASLIDRIMMETRSHDGHSPHTMKYHEGLASMLKFCVYWHC